ncbi:urea-proton symporter DUR3 [Eurytemora carolleeae]|uniref:urea-proton symporter DUR3 n=1 Tax=Eurytemora carolleeae TaxID=1294199 RepID=UPI000C762299|nr:urea-proton symporter DUR3 [Eurytemora carolleeae]|eukprot:XP_023321777.1 urea-proton symporter DUR3-like [Eurytemora affinis]
MVFALFTNIIVTLSLLLGGTAVLTGLVQGLSQEFASMLLVVLVGGFTLVGGLGGSFYVSYFTCATIFGLMLFFTFEIFYNPFRNVKNPFNGAEDVYDYVSCWAGPDDNQNNSWLTFYSSGGLSFGIVNIVGNFGAVFVDQSYWQSAVATKPKRGVWGFLFGGLTWFAVPFGLATTMSLGYHGLSSAQGSPILSDGDISAGLVFPAVAEILLGKLGGYFTIIMMLTAVMSTGSAEIIAVCSIIIYDIYIPYIKPFKKDLPSGHCILCEKPFRETSSNNKTCQCPSLNECTACIKDDEARAAVGHVVKPVFQCKIHAEYRFIFINLL